jgi:hypothetical protein
MAVAAKRLIKDVILGRCPRCGIGKLFSGWLTVAPVCSRCHLDFAVFDPGDGPAVFVILIEGALVMGGTLGRIHIQPSAMGAGYDMAAFHRPIHPRDVAVPQIGASCPAVSSPVGRGDSRGTTSSLWG